MSQNNENVVSITVNWIDDLVPESYKLVLGDYDLTCVNALPIKDGYNITVVGNNIDIEKFYEDFEDDSFATLDNISLKFDEDDDEYVAEVKSLIAKL